MSSESPGRQDVRTDALEFGLNPSLDAVFKLLSSQRRRHVLDCLKEREGPTELRELAEEVAARENDVPRAEVTTAEAKRVHLSLYHTHVPKLKDAGTVRHDEEDDTVALAVDPKRVERYEDFLDVE